MHVLFNVSLHSAEKQQPSPPYAHYTRQLSFNVIRVDKNKMLHFLFQSILFLFSFRGAAVGKRMGKDSQMTTNQTKE